MQLVATSTQFEVKQEEAQQKKNKMPAPLTLLLLIPEGPEEQAQQSALSNALFRNFCNKNHRDRSHVSTNAPILIFNAASCVLEAIITYF